MLRVIFNCLLVTNILLNIAHCRVPPISCPEYFQYAHDGVFFYGKLTLPNLRANSTTVDVQFSQQTPLQSDHQGTISLYQDDETPASDVAKDNQIVYRVTFPPDKVIPKLTRIALNGNVICTAEEYSPGTKLQLQHTLQNSVRHTSDSFNALNRILASRQSQNAPNTIPLQSTVIGDICGIGDPEIIQRIYTTSTSKSAIVPSEFPWLTAIFGKPSTRVGLICGGSLISSRTVLTAAHCMEVSHLNAEQLDVFLGRYSLNNPFENTYVQRDVQSIKMHPEYKESKVYADADIALLQLVSSVSFTHLIGPICLWSGPDDASLIVGKSGVVAGWGTDEVSNTISNVPRKAEANIVSDSQCLRSSPGFTALTSERTLCAGNRDGSGPCIGDSGSGLMVQLNGRWVLRGVVSAGMLDGERCNLLEYVVYCDVAKHLAWIQNNMLP